MLPTLPSTGTVALHKFVSRERGNNLKNFPTFSFASLFCSARFLERACGGRGGLRSLLVRPPTPRSCVVLEGVVLGPAEGQTLPFSSWCTIPCSGRFIEKTRTRMARESGDEGGGEGTFQRKMGRQE